MSDYQAFLEAKAARVPMRGLVTVPSLAGHLFKRAAKNLDEVDRQQTLQVGAA